MKYDELKEMLLAKSKRITEAAAEMGLQLESIVGDAEFQRNIFVVHEESPGAAASELAPDPRDATIAKLRSDVLTLRSACVSAIDVINGLGYRMLAEILRDALQKVEGEP